MAIVDEMNTRERFLKSMSFKTVDRPPNFELGYWGQTIERWIKEGMPVKEREKAVAAFYGHKYFGIEARAYLPLKLLAMPPFKVKIIKEAKRHIIYRDEDGILRKALKEGTVMGTRLSMDQYIDFPVKDKKDFEEMKKRFDPYTPRRYPDNWKEITEKYWKRKEVPLCLVPNGTLGFYSLARRWMGTVGISKAFYTKPRLVHEIMDYIADYIMKVTHRALHEAPIDYFNFFEDMADKKGPLMSLRIFKEFLFPRYKLVIEFLKRHGVKIIWLDSDGNVEPLIPLLIEAGVTCLWPLEVAAGMDPEKIRKEYGHEIAMSGGIDKREIAKEKKAIEKEVMRKVPSLVADGGYIPTLDHSVPPDVSYENFLYYLKVKKRAMEQSRL